MKTIEEIRDAFLRVHHVATGQSDRGYMSIPANSERDADLIVTAAIDELAAVRVENERLKTEATLSLQAAKVWEHLEGETRAREAKARALLERWAGQRISLASNELYVTTRELLRGEKAKARDTVLEAQQRTCEHEYKVQVGERVLCRNCTAEVAT